MASSASAEAAAYIQAQFAKAADLITTILSSVGTDSSTAFDTLVSAVKQSLNITIGTYVFAVKTIKATWDGLGFALADTIASAMNAVIATVESALRSITGAINGVLGAINSVSSAAGGATIDLFKGVDLPRIKNGYAGAGRGGGQGLWRGVREPDQGLRRRHHRRRQGRAEGSARQLQRQRRQARRGRKRPAMPSAADEKTAAELRASKKGKGGADDDDKKKGGGGGGGDKVNDYEREIKAIEKRTRAFDSERESLAKNALEVAKGEASFRLLEAAKKANIPVTDELRAKIDTLSTAYANAKVALDEAKEKQQQFEAGSRQAGSMLSDAFKDAILNGEKLTVVLDRLLKSLASKGFDSFFDTLFSKDGAGTNLFKSLLRRGRLRVRRLHRTWSEECPSRRRPQGRAGLEPSRHPQGRRPRAGGRDAARHAWLCRRRRGGGAVADVSRSDSTCRRPFIRADHDQRPHHDQRPECRCSGARSAGAHCQGTGGVSASPPL